MISRRTFGHAISTASLLALLPLRVLASNNIAATLRKSADCNCCEGYADYLRKYGFNVQVVVENHLPRFTQEAGVPADLLGCHTTFMKGYVVEGHVPLEALQKLLTERPAILGISITGMPTGLPGMPGSRVATIPIYEIVKGSKSHTVFMRLA